jgi:hypothetical protein
MEQQNDMQQKFNTNDDKDEDGIPDRYDKCPNEAGPLNLFGCPEVNNLDPLGKKSSFDPMDYIKSIEMVSIPIRFIILRVGKMLLISTKESILLCLINPSLV